MPGQPLQPFLHTCGGWHLSPAAASAAVPSPTAKPLLWALQTCLYQKCSWPEALLWLTSVLLAFSLLRGLKCTFLCGPAQQSCLWCQAHNALLGSCSISDADEGNEPCSHQQPCKLVLASMAGRAGPLPQLKNKPKLQKPIFS